MAEDEARKMLADWRATPAGIEISRVYREATVEEMRRAIMVGLRCRDDATGKMGYLYKNEFYVLKEESK